MRVHTVIGLILEALPLLLLRAVEGKPGIIVGDDVRRGLKRDDIHGLVGIQVGIQQVLKHPVTLIGASLVDTIDKDFIELKIAIGPFPQSSLHTIQTYRDGHSHSLGFIIICHPAQCAVQVQLVLALRNVSLLGRSFKVVEIKTNLQLLGQTMTILNNRAAGIFPGLDRCMDNKAVRQQIGDRHREQLLAIVHVGCRE